MRIGFIGLGAMGRPMAQHLLRAGHDLCVWSRRRESAAALVAQGAVWRESPAEVARHAEIICTNVTGSADVEGLAFGPLGLVEGFAPGALHVDFSTIAPAAARRIATRYAPHAVDFVDAPVSGGAKGAQDASLAIMWGGKLSAAVSPGTDLATRLKPLFALLGKTIVHVGDVGAGQVAKACNQMVMVAAIEAAAEAARLAAASGVDFTKVREAMQRGSAGSRVLDVFGGRMAERSFSAGVEARLHHKDYALLLNAALEVGAALPVCATVGQQLNALMSLDWGRHDSSALLRVLEAGAVRDATQ